MPDRNALNRHWDQNHGILLEAARHAGVDPAVLVKISGFESGFNPHARPINHRHPDRNTVRQFDGTMAMSSAYGLGQFTDDTWLDTVHRYGAKYGIENANHLSRVQANAPALRDDPRLQAAMLAEFTRDNVARGERLGGTDAEANVYALHNLGSGDGPKFLQALRDDPNKPVSAVLSRQVIRGNPALYGDGSRTLAEAYRVMGAKMDDYEEYAARTRVDARAPAPAPSAPSAAPGPKHAPMSTAGQNSAIYREAEFHFLRGNGRFEYGRGDTGRSHNRGGDGRTDQSRNERDLDGDGLKGVDCSSFVWRALRNAGFDVPPTPFTTRALFDGARVTGYARQHFDVVSASDARASGGALEPGDVLLFKDKHSAGQHVGIFKGYDAHGGIRFVGSQVTTGPAEASAAPHSYWNGDRFEIVGALRAKQEFRVRAPLHAELDHPVHTAAAHPAHRAAPVHTTPAADADAMLRPGEKGPAVATLQRRLFELDYRAKDGRPLKIDGDFGGDTLFAVQQFQREHGLEGKGVAGPKTAAALDRAEATLMTHPSHRQHALYEQALAKVQAAEKAKGIPVGPHSERVAAALVVECLREGLTRIDRVAISDTGKLAWAIEDRPGGRESGLGRTDGISLAQAANQPLAESSQQAHQVAVNVREQQQADLQRRAVQPAPAVAH